MIQGPSKRESTFGEKSEKSASSFTYKIEELQPTSLQQNLAFFQKKNKFLNLLCFMIFAKGKIGILLEGTKLLIKSSRIVLLILPPELPKLD